jgi:hypothetical protein
MKSTTNRMMLDFGALVALFMALAPESTYAIDKIEFKQVTATTTSAPAHGPYVVGSRGSWSHKLPRPELNATTREPVREDDDQDRADVGLQAAGPQGSEELGESASGAASHIPVSPQAWKVDPKAGLGVFDLDIAASSNHLLLGAFDTVALFKKDGTFLQSIPRPKIRPTVGMPTGGMRTPSWANALDTTTPPSVYPRS